MALRANVLQKKAEKFELKKLQGIEVTKERVTSLDTLLEDVYSTRRPKPTDYEVRKDLIRIFNEIAKEIYGKSKDIPVVVEFGSFVMDLFSPTSDLDLSVNFSTSADFPREMKIQTLRKFARKLYTLQSMGHIYGILPITTAKVPVLKCVDRGTGVECDISVENRDGISKSRIIHIISSIDERFKKLSFLLKVWAKANNVNSSKDKTLNSLSIILLVTFHLQTRNPPILPPFSAFFKDGNDPAAVEKSIPNFLNYGKWNRESLSELFITLLLKLSSVEKLWAKGLCASTCTASWTSKTWDSKIAPISVEDFTDRSQNVARAVGVAQVKQIYKCIDISIRNITAFMKGQIGLQLVDLLFGVDTSIPRGIPNLNLVAPSSCIPSQANPTTGIITAKRKKKPKRPGYFSKNIKSLTGSRPGKKSWKRKQVQQAMVADTSFSKKLRTDKGWRRMPYAAAQVKGHFPTSHVDPTSSWQCNRDGEQGESSDAGGWEDTHKPRSGWEPRESGWGSMQPSSGWEPRESDWVPRESGWGSMQPRGGWEPRESGWGSMQTRGGWEPRESGWGSMQPRGGWGVSQQNGLGAMQAGDGWEETHKPRGSGWGVSQQNGWGTMQPGGDWEGGNQQHRSGGWGSWQATQQPNVGVWGVGGWGGTQQHIRGGGAQTSDHRAYFTRF